MKSFPSWRYHSSKPARIVQDEAEDTALGPGWYHSPADVFAGVTAEPAPPPAEPTPPTVQEIVSPPPRRKR